MGTRRAAVFIADWLEGITRKAGVWLTLFAFLGAELGLGLPARRLPHPRPGSRFRSPQVTPR